MTDRKKLIELQIANCNSGKPCALNCLECMADHLLANGVRLESKQATSDKASDENKRWIPVSERLPEHGGIALCRLTFNELRILQWDNVSRWWLGYGAGDDWRQKDVTHWMPLPEPPKEEDNV